MNDELIARTEKKVFEHKNGVFSMNIPKQAVQLLGKRFIFDIYKDKIVMTPVKK